MSTPKFYPILSILIILALLFNATSMMPAALVVAAPIKSEAKAPQAQATNFDIKVAIHNRDGLPLSGVDRRISTGFPFRRISCRSSKNS